MNKYVYLYVDLHRSFNLHENSLIKSIFGVIEHVFWICVQCREVVEIKSKAWWGQSLTSMLKGSWSNGRCLHGRSVLQPPSENHHHLSSVWGLSRDVWSGDVGDEEVLFHLRYVLPQRLAPCYQPHLKWLDQKHANGGWMSPGRGDQRR